MEWEGMQFLLFSRQGLAFSQKVILSLQTGFLIWILLAFLFYNCTDSCPDILLWSEYCFLDVDVSCSRKPKATVWLRVGKATSSIAHKSIDGKI